MKVLGVEEEEYCYIPMGGELPDLAQRVVGFGGAANMVHPATGRYNNLHSSGVLYCTVLYCTVLYCIVLYCTVLYCTVLYCTVLYCTVLYCALVSK